jgi:acetyltransferase-like isoleucine patch superfamily enzyme
MNNVNVGNFTSIAEGVIFDGGFNHNTENVTTFPLHTIWSELPSNIDCKGDITIGSDVWIGEDAIIMSGVTIGDGAIIGARTIVTQDVQPYSVVIGAPMKHKRYRIPPFYIEDMQRIEWWSWDNEKIKENAHLLNSDNIQDFINKHKP